MTDSIWKPYIVQKIGKDATSAIGDVNKTLNNIQKEQLQLKKEKETLVQKEKLLKQKLAEQTLEHRKKVISSIEKTVKDISTMIYMILENLGSEIAIEALKSPTHDNIKKILKMIQPSIIQIHKYEDEFRTKIGEVQTNAETIETLKSPDYHDILATLNEYLLIAKMCHTRLVRIIAYAERDYIPQLKKGWTGMGAQNQGAAGMLNSVSRECQATENAFKQITNRIPTTNAQKEVTERGKAALKSLKRVV